jgi:hypothetical protein
VGAVALASDQRGIARPQGGQCDAGAFEAPVPPPACQDVAAATGSDQAVAITLSCTGPGTTTYQLAGTPSHGALSALDANAGTVTYTPNAGYSGPDSFTYNAQNAGGTSPNATVSITVNPPASASGPPPGSVPVVPVVPGPAQPVQKCIVPKLKGKSLSKARKALAKAHCKLGKVTKPKVKKGHKRPVLVVGSSKPKAGARLRAGSKVAIKLVPAPKKRKR